MNSRIADTIICRYVIYCLRSNLSVWDAKAVGSWVDQVSFKSTLTGKKKKFIHIKGLGSIFIPISIMKETSEIMLLGPKFLL